MQTFLGSLKKYIKKICTHWRTQLCYSSAFSRIFCLFKYVQCPIHRDDTRIIDPLITLKGNLRKYASIPRKRFWRLYGSNDVRYCVSLFCIIHVIWSPRSVGMYNQRLVSQVKKNPKGIDTENQSSRSNVLNPVFETPWYGLPAYICLFHRAHLAEGIVPISI